MTFSEIITKYRKELGLTQEGLALKLGVTNQAVSKWESGQSCPDISLLPKIADLFGITIDELFYSVEKKLKPQEQEPAPQTEEGKHKRKWIWLCAAAVVIVLLLGMLLAAIGHKEDVKEPIPIDEIQGVVIDPDEIIEAEFEPLE